MKQMKEKKETYLPRTISISNKKNNELDFSSNLYVKEALEYYEF